MTTARAAFLADADRYSYYDGSRSLAGWPRTRARLIAFLKHPGLQAMAVYRFGSWVEGLGAEAGARRTALQALYFALSRLSQIVTGIWIAPTAVIGPGLYIGHFGGVIIGPATIGANCSVANDVTLGKSGRGTRSGLPTLGDRVNIAAGARVLGPVTVGDDVLIGANAVVVQSLPPRSVVGGVPATVISDRGAFDYLEYPGMETDERRIASMAQLTEAR